MTRPALRLRTNTDIHFDGKKHHRLVNEMNARDHWRVEVKRKKAQKKLVADVLGWCDPPKLPVTITFTLHSAGSFDEGDGLPAALKHVRDAVAKWLGCDDAPESPVTWVYAKQVRCKRGQQWANIAWEEVRE